jgi:hypothetical protein
VASQTVVERFQVVEDGRSCALTCGPGRAVEELGLEGSEEALGGCIVEAGPGSTDARANAIGGQLADVRRAQILTGFKGSSQHLRKEMRCLDQSGDGQIGHSEPECSRQVVRRLPVERTGNASGRPLPRA